jgi:hypothetical protein
MSRLSLKPSVIKRLFALSGNECAFPNCPECIVNTSGTVIGEICHIEAAEQGGERFNDKSNDEYRRSFKNLVLFCSNHHKATNDTIIYTTPKLLEIKAKHENRNFNNPITVSDETVDKAIENYMQQGNKNEGSGSQINNQAKTQNIHSQIGTINIHHYEPVMKNDYKIEDARNIVNEFKVIIDRFKQKASPPSTDVIDFKNELLERFERPIELIPTKYLKFRKDNGRIASDVQSYEQENNVVLNESAKETQEILKRFLKANDNNKNDELKQLLSQKGQLKPAIITCDGFLIDGNRRKMALEDLFDTNNQSSKYEMMRVVILPEGVSELEVQQLENRIQLQSDGRSEYQGLNRALTIKRNIDIVFKHN